MDIRSLRYFVELVRQQSFTRAAAQLHLTQPTISKMVRLLEDELGQPLLIRHGKQFTLTDAGRITFRHGEALLGGLQQLHAELADLATLQLGELRLGLPPMVGAACFAPVVSAYQARYPAIALQLIEDGALAIEEKVRTGALEIGVAVLPVDPAGFDHLAIIEEPLCLVAPAGSHWHGRTSVKLADIADQRFVLYPEDFTLSQRIEDAFRRLDRPLQLSGRSAHWDFITELVSAKLGVTLLPRSVSQRLNRQQFDIVELAEAALNWRLALIWRRGGYLSHAARAWIRTTREQLTLAPEDSP